MKELLEILNGLHPEIDFTKEMHLVEDRILDSFDIVSLIAELNDCFDVVIPPEEIISENFNSAERIFALVERFMEE